MTIHWCVVVCVCESLHWHKDVTSCKYFLSNGLRPICITGTWPFLQHRVVVCSMLCGIWQYSRLLLCCSAQCLLMDPHVCDASSRNKITFWWNTMERKSFPCMVRLRFDSFCSRMCGTNNTFLRLLALARCSDLPTTHCSYKVSANHTIDPVIPPFFKLLNTAGIINDWSAGLCCFPHLLRHCQSLQGGRGGGLHTFSNQGLAFFLVFSHHKVYQNVCNTGKKCRCESSWRPPYLSLHLWRTPVSSLFELLVPCCNFCQDAGEVKR